MNWKWGAAVLASVIWASVRLGSTYPMYPTDWVVALAPLFAVICVYAIRKAIQEDRGKVD
jgi:hypothetical protein